MSPVRVRAPAKVNLWLEVLRRREDGYHDLSTLMLPLRVGDDVAVELRPTAEGITLSCEAEGVPADARNLAHRAAAAYLSRTGWETGVALSVLKRTPVGAGLGGGSSDAAAVLRVLNALAPHPLPLDALLEVGRSLGADVPFFVLGVPALATGIGEVLEPVSGLPAYPLVLITPPVHVATGTIYRRLTLTRGTPRITLTALLAGPWCLSPLMENDLESVTASDHPVVSDIRGWLLENGALGARMSGSGPTVFGVFRTPGEAARTGALAVSAWPGCRVLVTETAGSGPPSGGAAEGA